MTIDEALAEIETIRIRLAGLPDDHPDRDGLEARRLELRAAARRAADASRNPDYLRLELRHLERRLAALDRKTIKLPRWMSAMKWFNDPEASIAAINRKLEEVDLDDRLALEARIAELRLVLGDERRPGHD